MNAVPKPRGIVVKYGSALVSQSENATQEARNEDVEGARELQGTLLGDAARPPTMPTKPRRERADFASAAASEPHREPVSSNVPMTGLRCPSGGGRTLAANVHAPSTFASTAPKGYVRAKTYLGCPALGYKGVATEEGRRDTRSPRCSRNDHAHRTPAPTRDDDGYHRVAATQGCDTSAPTTETRAQVGWNYPRPGCAWLSCVRRKGHPGG
ncbi:uncharacterized protein LOC144159196 isoform X2 [Haemaphysalis longicornis]